MNNREYWKDRIMSLMNEIETKHNRYHKKETFESAYPKVTEEIWRILDESYKNKNTKGLLFLIEKLSKLSDSY